MAHIYNQVAPTQARSQSTKAPGHFALLRLAAQAFNPREALILAVCESLTCAPSEFVQVCACQPASERSATLDAKVSQPKSRFEPPADSLSHLVGRELVGFEGHKPLSVVLLTKQVGGAHTAQLWGADVGESIRSRVAGIKTTRTDKHFRQLVSSSLAH